MKPTTLRDTSKSFLPHDLFMAAARLLEVQQRVKMLDVYGLMVALVLTAGSDDSGRQADEAAYLEEAEQPVVRGTFYAWSTNALAALLRHLLVHALETVWEQPPSSRPC